MKWLSAAMQPVSFCTSFKVVDEFILNMSLSFFGLASMPRYDTMKPSSFPEGSPKTHFSGFSFHLKRLKFANVLDMSDMGSVAPLPINPAQVRLSYLIRTWNPLALQMD